MPTLKDKNVVVTGACRGIGEAIALAFAKKGANVTITYKSNQNLADQVVQKLLQVGVKANKIKLDVSEKNERASFVEQCYEFGDIDILINNAGTASRNSFLRLSETEVRDIMEVNFMGPFFLMQAFASKMVATQQNLAKQQQKLNDYCIVNITSISQSVVMPGLCHYEASKAALNQLTKSSSIDLAKYKIRINSVSPGIIPTDLNRQVREQNKPVWDDRINATPLNRAGEPDEIAQGVIFVASNPWITGTTLVIDGGRSHNWDGSNISHDLFTKI